jgi:hypothetical protein
MAMPVPLVVAKLVPLAVWAPVFVAKLPVGPVAAPSWEVATLAGFAMSVCAELMAAAVGMQCIQCMQLTGDAYQWHTFQRAASHALSAALADRPHRWLE